MADLTRYHQIGVASGWVEVDGERTEINEEEWICTRDHSWGCDITSVSTPRDLEPPYELDQIEGLQ